MQELPDLVAQAQNGDKDAFGKIYNEYYLKIYKYCQFNLRDKVLAQDLVQETFLKAWKSLNSYTDRKGGTFQAFLFKIARNLIIDNSRKKKEARLADYEEVEEHIDLEGEIDSRSDQKKMRIALEELNEVERQIIILRYFEDLSFEEVSRVVKIKEGALRVRVHRILEKLKGILEEKND